jgi:hypothetical protein
MSKLVSSVIIFSFIFFNMSIVNAGEKEIVFPDVVKDSWYEDSVKTLTAAGIIDGFTDGTFRPDQNIKVDEFIKLLVTAAGITPDASGGYWAQRYIDAAYDNGYIKQGEISDFKRNVSRGEMSRMIVRAAGGIPGPYDAYQKDIGDFCEIDARYRDYALAGYGMGIIAGIGGRFVPYAPASRKEACVMIHRLIDKNKRLEVSGLGSLQKRLTAGDLYSMLKNKGYETTETTDPEDMLTREKLAYIIYTSIMTDESLGSDIIPVSETVVRPIVFLENDRELSGSFYSICSNTRTIEQNFQALQIFDIMKTYSGGRTKKILNFNIFKDNDTINDAPKDMVGIETVSRAEVRRRFDHMRFEDIFTDSYQIDDVYKEAFFRLYDWGILDLHEFSEHTFDIYCSPDAAVLFSEADEAIARLDSAGERTVLDEKVFGVADSWGKDLYGSDLYTFRLSEIKMIYLYDTISEYELCLTRIDPKNDGIYMLMSCIEEPYFDDSVKISDNCAEGDYNHTETVPLAGFKKYEITKYGFFVPRAYREQIIKDLTELADLPGCLDLKANYGGFEFEAHKYAASDRPYIIIKYAYREDGNE